MQAEHQVNGFDDEEEDDEPPLLVSLDVDDKDPTNENTVDSVHEQETTPTPPTPPCPVTILSGFLGSGKTTLIQHILKSPNHGKRIAVIENEFGEGLDVESMIARDGTANNESLQDLIELPNGCMCCTVKDSLVATLEVLVERRADLDYILIECSGMANPGPIASLFWLDEALGSRLRLDGIVTLIDAVHINEQLKTTEEAAQQIAYADRILLNKMDLVQNENEAVSLTALIRQFHPMAPIRQTTFSSVPDLDWILDARCFDSDRFHSVDETLQSLVSESMSHSHEHHSHHHDHVHDEDEGNCVACQAASHKHTSGITSFALLEDGALDLQKLNRWLASALWPNQDATNKTLQALIHDELPKTAQHQSAQNDAQQIFRMKGVIAVRQYDASDTYDEKYVTCDMLDKRRFILQSVHDLWDLYPASDDLQWKAEEDRTNKVVVIGKNLDEASLREGFRECVFA
mmetsp:Transcript_12739/g.24221  ORF Transcript_12739/g.24221 Transcript_12739/m.24221 type:complete len:461 (-) Transcript_12739:11-1393(-)